MEHQTIDGTRATISTLSQHCVQPHWYAIYVLANHEKSVQRQLENRLIQSFLPVYECVRRWKDRKVRLQLPLFPGYTFVRILLRDRLQVLQVPSVVNLVGFNGAPTPLPGEEIAALQNGLARGVRAEPHAYLAEGRPVRVVKGPLEGAEGILLRKKSCTRVVISLNLIRRSVAVEIDPLDLEYTR